MATKQMMITIMRRRTALLSQLMMMVTQSVLASVIW
jgi:hypothetical protein